MGYLKQAFDENVKYIRKTKKDDTRMPRRACGY